MKAGGGSICAALRRSYAEVFYCQCYDATVMVGRFSASVKEHVLVSIWKKKDY